MILDTDGQKQGGSRVEREHAPLPAALHKCRSPAAFEGSAGRRDRRLRF